MSLSGLDRPREFFFHTDDVVGVSDDILPFNVLQVTIRLRHQHQMKVNHMTAAEVWEAVKGARPGFVHLVEPRP